MYTLILTLIVFGSQQQTLTASTSVTSIPGYATEAECKTAGSAWENKQEIRSVDKSWTARKSSVCSKASAK